MDHIVLIAANGKFCHMPFGDYNTRNYTINLTTVQSNYNFTLPRVTTISMHDTRKELPCAMT